MPQHEDLAPHEKKRHVSQSHLELQALYRLFRATGGAGDGSSVSGSSWKTQTGWPALESAAAKLAGDSLLARGTMATQFPLFGVTWERNHVVAIDLSSNGLCGKIPNDIAHLRFLQTLKLRDNPGLRGAVPESVCSMPHLRYCYLDGTGLQRTLPYETAHSLQITRFHASGTAATVCFITDNPHGHIRWTSDVTESEMFMMHSSLRALHERPKTQETTLAMNAHNATGPERTAAAIKLQRIYRARIERTKFRQYLQSLVHRAIDPSSGYEYFVDARTGEASWDAPAFFAAASQRKHHADNNNNSGEGSATDRGNSLSAADAWQPYDDGNGNTVRLSWSLETEQTHLSVQH